MDTNILKQKATSLFQKYKYVLVVVLAGLALMLLPTSEPEVQTPPQQLQTETEAGIAEQLEQILAQIEGVGRVRVMLTMASAGETVYQTDEDRTSDGGVRVETVIVSGADREEAGLVKTVTPPVYLGAIVVCQGADRPTVQLAIVRAVSNVTGISSERITVLKMK